MPSALEGLRVLDLTRLLPGPYAGMILGDLGAEVLKVEDTGAGDPMRWIQGDPGPGNSTFGLINRNKRSIAIDLKAPEGKGLFEKLVRKCDVVLEGFRPGVMDRLGVGWERLRSLNPTLIFCSISGYGQDGPMRDRSGHDVNYLALAGFLGLQTDFRGRPVLSGVQVADLGGALFAVIGILAALAARVRHGTGQYVDLAMMDVGLSLMPVAAGRHFSGQPVLLGARLPLSGSLACYNLYETADGRHLSVGALEPKFWERFCRVMEKTEYIGIQFAEDKQPGMIREIERLVGSRRLEEWIERFEGADACVEPVLSLAEALETPQARHRRLAPVTADFSGRVSRQLGLPFRLSNTPPACVTAAPSQGEHTRQILEFLGIPEDQVERLFRDRIVR